MISMVVLLVSWKRFRRAFWFLLPFATGLIISTIYCRYHYAIDVIAGIAFAAITVPLSDRLYDWWNARWKAATQTGRSYIR